MLQPGALRHIVNRAAGEVLMARLRTRLVETAARGPATHHRVGHVGMKLDAESVAILERLVGKVASFGDPRLYAMSLVSEILSKSQQPIVPRQVFTSGDQDASLVGTLLRLVTAEKIGELDLDQAQKIVNQDESTGTAT